MWCGWPGTCRGTGHEAENGCTNTTLQISYFKWYKVVLKGRLHSSLRSTSLPSNKMARTSTYGSLRHHLLTCFVTITARCT